MAAFAVRFANRHVTIVQAQDTWDAAAIAAQKYHDRKGEWPSLPVQITEAGKPFEDHDWRFPSPPKKPTSPCSPAETSPTSSPPAPPPIRPDETPSTTGTD